MTEVFLERTLWSTWR